MSRSCQITGKRPQAGNHVSHAQNKRRRRFLPNLHKRRLWSDVQGKFITLKVSASTLRLIDKKGLDNLLEDSNGLKA